MSIEALQDYVYTSKYSRYTKKRKRREVWDESVDRVRDMHLGRYPQIADEINWAFDQVREKRVLGSQRALQFGGEPILRKHARLYNCLKEDTPFITNQGVRTFADYSDGDRVMVLTHLGNWMPATVRSYGEQPLNRILIKRGKAEQEVYATANHRWILKGGTETTSLKVGDRLAFGPDVFNEFKYEDALPDERLYWAYGYVYGDGTKVKDGDGQHKYSMVRLCGDQVKYLNRFEELGFNSSSHHSLEGDVMVYTGKYLKTLPDPKEDSPRLIRAFVRGYLDADGARNSNCRPGLTNNSPTPYDSIQATGKEAIEFIRECFPIAGVYIVSEEDKTGEVTNYGPRTEETIRFRIINGFGKTAASFTVEAIEEDVSREKVWCLEVEEDHSFVMPNGLPTGNCTVSYCDRMRFFQEAFWLLLCGCGVGFSVQQHHVAKLPDFDKGLWHRVEVGGSLEQTGGEEWGAAWKERRTYRVPDTIEGWADALGILLATYMPSPGYEEWAGVLVEFDFSDIRPAGSILSSGSGKAPGPEPLKRSLEVIRGLLNRLLKEGRTRLRPIDAYDVVCHASDAVLSGGVRRSATICIFSLEDDEMMKAKTGDWFFTNPQRARSNNSVLLLRDRVTEEQFLKIIESVKEFGEPGFLWSDSTELMVNPCVEIGMWPVCHLTGLSGWQFCNLCELNGKLIKSREDWRIAARAAAIIGTCQAGYTDFDYLGEVTKRITEREALLGVSITGMMDSPDVIFDEELQREMAQYILEINEEIAPKIGVRPTARATCVKPAGTSSCVLGTGSGIHPHHARRYIRRIQGNTMEAPLQFYKGHNPHAVERSVWSANGTDEVISFAIEVDEDCRVKPDLSAIELLEHVRLTQVNWVMSGCVPERCTQPWLRHNVSNTINVKPDEWLPVGKYIYKYRENFAGVSLLPATGDRDYPQSPMVQVFTPAEIVAHYGDAGLFASGLIVDGLHAFDDNLWLACEHALGHQKVECKTPPVGTGRYKTHSDWTAWLPGCVQDFLGLREEIVTIPDEPWHKFKAQQDWVRRAIQFADRYFQGDVKKATYCLKDVDNWHTFVALMRQDVPVDYSEMLEEDDNTTLRESMACSGGKCELI